MEKEKLKVETDENGTVTYRNADDELHNENGPAVIYADGDKEYYINGQLHNENGPAMVGLDGSKYHYINGYFHNPHGPAIVHTDGSKEYYKNGNMLSEAEFNTWQAQLIAK
jgi:hypothetical protein